MNVSDTLSRFEKLLARRLPTERHTHHEPVSRGIDPYGGDPWDAEGRAVTTEELSWPDAAQWVLEADVEIKRVFPPGHALRSRWEAILASTEGKNWQLGEEALVRATRTVLQAACAIVRDGGLQPLFEEIRAETVLALLDRASELLDEKGAPLPAVVVLVGGALETHLRHLCELADPQHSDPVWHKAGSIDAYKGALDRARKSGTTNVSLGDTKQVAAWGDRRNKAAHTPLDLGMSKEEVRLMIEGVRQFLLRTSAS